MTQSTTTRLIDLRTGAVQEIPNTGGEVTATGASDLNIDLASSAILGSMRVGDDLIVNLVGGGQIIVRDFYAFARTGDVVDAAGMPVSVDADSNTTGVGDGDGLSATAKTGIALAGIAAVVAVTGAGSDDGKPPPRAEEPAPTPPTPAEVALTKINDYNAMSTATQTPTVADYGTAGVTGVTAGNLAAVNAAVLAAADGLTVAQVGELVTGAVNAALAAINGYDAMEGTAVPTVATYATAGVAGVTGDNLAVVNAAVAASEDDELTAMEIGALVTMAVESARATINNYDAMDGSAAPTIATYTAVGVSSVTEGNLAAVNAAVAASADDELTAMDIEALVTMVVAAALATLNAYDGTDATTEPTLATYTTAGVTGVNAVNLALVNGRVADSDIAMLTAGQVTGIVTMVIREALDVINAYDGTAGSTEPTVATYATAGIPGVNALNLDELNELVADADFSLNVADFAALVAMANAAQALETINAYDASNVFFGPTVATWTTAGVTGVTEGNLDAVNAAAALPANDQVDTVAEYTTLVAMVVAEALATINAYDDAMDSTTPAPTVATYATAGVAGVIDGNLAAVNTAVAAAADGLTVAAVGELVTGVANTALATLNAYETGDTGDDVPTVATYGNAGVTGVTADNLRDVNTRVAASDNAMLTTMDVQGLVALQRINDYSGASTGDAVLELADYTAAGVTGVTASNLGRVNALVAASDDDGLTTMEIQALVARADARIKIDAYEADDMGDDVPTLADYTAAGFTNVTAANLAGVNVQVAASDINTLTPANITTFVTNYNTALTRVNDFDGDGTPAAPRLIHYTNLGVTGVTADNIAQVNRLARESMDTELTPEEIMALVAPANMGVMALAKINAYEADDTGDDVPTVADYEAAGFDNVDAANLLGVNVQVAASTEDALEQGDITGFITVTTMALATIRDYDSSSNAPDMDDYTNAGVTGVTAGNLAAVNMALIGDNAMGVAAIQEQVDAVVALAKINDHDEMSDADATPTVADYMTAGFTGVNDGNLRGINAQVATSNVAALAQSNIDAFAMNTMEALGTISDYDGDGTPAAPELSDYINAGVTGVTDGTNGNIDEVNERVGALVHTDPLTLAEIQSQVALQRINDYTSGATGDAVLEIADYTYVGATGVTMDNRDRVNTAVAAAVMESTEDLASAAIQEAVAEAVALAKINDYDGMEDTPVPTAQDYMTAGFTGVDAENLAGVNAQVAASSDNELMQADITGFADAVTAALMLINAYEADDTGNDVPTMATYTNAGVTDATADNVPHLNSLVAASTNNDLGAADLTALVMPANEGVMALARINAFTNTFIDEQAPTLADYTAAGVTGVTEGGSGNIFTVNAAVAAAADTLTIMGVQDLVQQVIALEKINDYDAQSTPAQTPTLADYMAAGVTDVTDGTDGNLDAVNAAVLAATDTLTTMGVQELVDAVVALAKITDYDDMSTMDETPDEDDYAAAGVTRVTAGNLAQVNVAVRDPDADDATVAQIQTLVDGVVAELAGPILTKINQYQSSDMGSNAEPTAADYVAVGVTGVTANNLDDVNADVAASMNNDLEDSDIQMIVRDIALDKIEAHTATSSPGVPIVQDYVNAGVTGVNADNLNAVNAYVAAAADALDDTTAEIQDLVDDVTEVLDKINAFNAATSTAMQTPTMDDYELAGVTGVTMANLPVVNDQVSRSADTALTATDIQGFVDMATTYSLGKITDYEQQSNPSTPAPTAADYTVAGATDVDADRVAQLNALVRTANVAANTNTDITVDLALIQSLVNVVAQVADAQGVLGTSDTFTTTAVTSATALSFTIDNDAGWMIEVDLANNQRSITFDNGTVERTELDTDRDGNVNSIEYDDNRDGTADRFSYDDGTGANAVADDGTIDRNVVRRLFPAAGLVLTDADDDDTIDLVEVTGTVVLDGTTYTSLGLTKSLDNMTVIRLDAQAASQVTISANDVNTLALIVQGGGDDSVALQPGRNSDGIEITWGLRDGGNVSRDVDGTTNTYAVWDAEVQTSTPTVIGSLLVQTGVNISEMIAVPTLMSRNGFVISNDNLPEIGHYTQLGVTGVTGGDDGNLNDVNNRVIATGRSNLTVAEVQALVALQRINDYEDGSTGAAMLTIADYANAGVLGVTPDNLDGVNTRVADSTDTDLTAAEVQALVSLQRINDYESTDTLFDVLTVADYTAAGVTGVAATILPDVNALVADSTDNDLTVAEVQDLVSLYRINEHESTDAGVAVPTVADYTAVGVSGVTAANLSAVNARVAASPDDDLDEPAINEIVQAVNAEIEALAIFNAYDDDNGDGTANTGVTTPTLAHYMAAGVETVTALNLNAVNALVLALPNNNLERVHLLELERDARGLAQQKINNLQATDVIASRFPTVDDYGAIGVSGVTEDLVAIMAGQLLVLSVTSNREPANIQAQVQLSRQLRISNYSSSSTNQLVPVVIDYESIGVFGVTEDNLDAVNRQLLTLNAGIGNRDAEDIQPLVAAMLQPKINDYDASSTGDDIPTALDYATIGVFGVSEGNLADVNPMVRELDTGSGNRDASDIQPLVTPLVQAKIDVYNSGSTAEDFQVPTVSDYRAIGVTGVTEDNLDAINALVLDLAAGSGNRDALDIQPLVAEFVINSLDGDGIDALTAYDYAALGINGLTATRVGIMNDLVEEIMEDGDLLIDGQITEELLQQLADFFALADVSDLIPTTTVIDNIEVTDSSIYFDMDYKDSSARDRRIEIELDDNVVEEIRYLAGDGVRFRRHETFTVENGRRTRGEFDTNGNGIMGRAELYVYDDAGHLIQTWNYRDTNDNGVLADAGDTPFRIDVFTVNEVGHRLSAASYDGSSIEGSPDRMETYTLTEEGLREMVSFDLGRFSGGYRNRYPRVSGDADGIADRTETYIRNSEGHITETRFDDGDRDRNNNVKIDGTADGITDRTHTYVLNAQGGRIETHYDSNGDGTSDEVGYHEQGRDDHLDRVEINQGYAIGEGNFFVPDVQRDGRDNYGRVIRMFGTGRTYLTGDTALNTDLGGVINFDLTDRDVVGQLRHILLPRRSDDLNFDGRPDNQQIDAHLAFSAADFGRLAGSANNAIVIWGDSGDRISLEGNSNIIYFTRDQRNGWRRPIPSGRQVVISEDVNGDGRIDSSERGRFNVFGAAEVDGDILGVVYIHDNIRISSVTYWSEPPDVIPLTAI